MVEGVLKCTTMMVFAVDGGPKLLSRFDGNDFTSLRETLRPDRDEAVDVMKMRDRF